MLLQEPHILAQRSHLLQRHSPPDAAADGGLLVKAEIHACGGQEKHVDLLQTIAFGRLPVLQQVRMAADACQLGGDPHRRQNKVDHAGRDRARRHGRPGRRLRVLREGDPAFRLNRSKPQRPVRSAAGENHTDGGGLLLPRQRGTEFIDGMVRNRSAFPRNQLQSGALDGHALVGWNHVYVVPMQRHAVGYFKDRHGGDFGEKLRQRTLVLGGQMLDHHNGHPSSRGQSFQKPRQGFQPAR